ncbi:uncharacterized protein LOC128675759 [Plodia interpunctella]|uniref:uncharacterized protein LOC128675759 n=1 Tax=Plodia interpunctella TaxID=58824 RepID=UPI00236844ED|nr:uncharacterized protein LOC128675759 [Plodia interpunctella]
MQCQQPPFGINLPYSGQYFPCNPVNPFNGLAPDVIGEGEVNSITFPDGSIQYYFLPVRWRSDIHLKRWPPCPFNDNMFYNYSKPNPGLWIIRNFSNTISPVYNQYWQRTNPDPFTKSCFGYDNNVVPAGFQLKFHNDCWTSTTDLHYFCPYLPPVPPIVPAASVETPIEIKCLCRTTDCNHSDNTSASRMLKIMKEYNKTINRCKCNKSDKDSSSKMSIDKSKTSPCSSNASLKKSEFRKSKRKTLIKEPKKKLVICKCSVDSIENITEDKKSNENTCHLCEKNSQHTAAHVKCICEDTDLDRGETSPTYSVPTTGNSTSAVQTADKVVATYLDQASSVPDAEGQTQTECRCWPPTDVKEEQRSHKCHDVKEEERLCNCNDVKEEKRFVKLHNQHNRHNMKEQKSERPKRRRRRTKSSEKLLGVYDYNSGCSTSESFCTICNSD